MTTVLLIRHGQTLWNVEHRFQGAQDSPLSELGQHQAAALAQRFRTKPPDALFSSPLGRAQTTAQAIADTTGLETQHDERLREKAYGIFEGLTFAEIEQRFPNELANFRSGDLNYVVPGGESSRSVFVRVMAALNDLAQHHPNQRIAVVTHGGIVIGLLRQLFGMEHQQARRLGLLHTGIHTIHHQASGWQPGTLGDTRHTEALTP